MFYFQSYLDLYVFFCVEIYVLFILIPVFIIVHALFLPFENSLWNRTSSKTCQQETHFRSVKSGCSLLEQRKVTGSCGTTDRRFGLVGQGVYCHSWNNNEGPAMFSRQVFYPASLWTSVGRLNFHCYIYGPLCTRNVLNKAKWDCQNLRETMM